MFVSGDHRIDRRPGVERADIDAQLASLERVIAGTSAGAGGSFGSSGTDLPMIIIVATQ